MRNNGFTLTELLAVIAILGTILAIVTISAIKISNQRRESDYINIQNMAISSTKTMVEVSYSLSDKIDDKMNSNNTNECKIPYEVLINKNYMDTETENPVNEKEKPIKDTCIKITRVNSTNYEYKYEFIENKSDCDKLILYMFRNF